MGNQAHRIGACILLVFILSHLGVHLTALLGISAHQSSLTFVQSVYRNPVGETLLVLVIVMQIISGAAKLKRTGRSGPVSYTHLRSPRDLSTSRMPSSA